MALFVRQLPRMPDVLLWGPGISPETLVGSVAAAVMAACGVSPELAIPQSDSGAANAVNDAPDRGGEVVM